MSRNGDTIMLNSVNIVTIVPAVPAVPGTPAIVGWVEFERDYLADPDTSDDWKADYSVNIMANEDGHIPVELRFSGRLEVAGEGLTYDWGARYRQSYGEPIQEGSCYRARIVTCSGKDRTEARKAARHMAEIELQRLVDAVAKRLAVASQTTDFE